MISPDDYRSDLIAELTEEILTNLSVYQDDIQDHVVSLAYLSIKAMIQRKKEKVGGGDLDGTVHEPVSKK